MATENTGNPVKPDWQKEIEKEVNKPIIHTSETGGVNTDNEFLVEIVKQIGKKVYDLILASFAKNSYEGSVPNDGLNASNTVKSGLPSSVNYSRIIYLKINGYRSQYIYSNNTALAYTKWYLSRGIIRFTRIYDKIDLGDDTAVKKFFADVTDSPNEFYLMFSQIGNTNFPTREQKRDYMALFETAIHFGKQSKGWIENTKSLNGGVLPTGGTGGTGTGTTGTGGTGPSITTGTTTDPTTPQQPPTTATGSSVVLLGLGLFAGWLLLKDSDKK